MEKHQFVTGQLNYTRCQHSKAHTSNAHCLCHIGFTMGFPLIPHASIKIPHVTELNAKSTCCHLFCDTDQILGSFLKKENKKQICVIPIKVYVAP